ERVGGGHHQLPGGPLDGDDRVQASCLLREDPDHFGLEARELLLAHQRLVELLGQALQERGLADHVQVDQDPAESLCAPALSLEGGRELFLREQTALDKHLTEELPPALALARAFHRGHTSGLPVLWGYAISSVGHC